MKKMFLLFTIIVCSAELIQAQTFNTVLYKRLRFYHENGRDTSAISLGDTLCSERIMLDADAFSWGMTTATNTDTMHLHVQIRYGAGTGAGVQGYYTQGGQTMNTTVDSIETNGARDGDATAAHAFVIRDMVTGNTQTTIAAGAQDSRDSTRTVTNTYTNTAVSQNGWQWFQICLVADGAVENNVGSAGLAKSLLTFNTNRLIILRK